MNKRSGRGNSAFSKTNTSDVELFEKRNINGGNKMGRIIIFTGKGGVGKTSVAAAHGRKAAREGKKTIIISTDMAHNLSDLFETPLEKEPVEVTKNLFALEVDPNYIMENNFPQMMNSIDKMMNGMLGSDSTAKEPIMFPGIEELFSLLKIKDIYDKNEYELIIVDCAPTGETLSLLKFPELLSWYMEKFFPIGKIGMRIIAPISKQFMNMELPGKEAMNDIEKAYGRLLELQDLLKNKEVCSVRLVTIPEKMVFEETKRNYMYMNLYNFNVDGIYINRILPSEVEDEFFHEWLILQNHYINEMEKTFGNIPVYKIPWYDIDVNGFEPLDRIVEDALQYKDIFEVKQIVPNETYEKIDDTYLLTVFLPGVKKEKMEMHQSASDLIIKLDNFKRSIPIPGILRTYEISSAKIEDSKLKVKFVPKQELGA